MRFLKSLIVSKKIYRGNELLFSHGKLPILKKHSNKNISYNSYVLSKGLVYTKSIVLVWYIMQGTENDLIPGKKETGTL